MKGLVIDEPWISAILAGRKTWEMRKGACNVRGRIALIRKGSGQVVGVADVVDCLPEIDTAEAYARAEAFHGIPSQRQARAFQDGWRTPWVLKNARPLAKPVTYRHKNGAVIWVTLDEDVLAAVERDAGSRSESTTPAASPPRTVAPASPTARSGAADSGGKAPARTASRGGPPGARMRIQGRIEGDRCFIPISDGNIKNHHIYLRSVLSFFPSDCVGGSDESQRAARSLTVAFDGGPTISTDIAGPDLHEREGRSAHYFFRNARSGVLRAFFERFGAQAGDEVVIRRDAPYIYSVGLLKPVRS